MEILEISIVGLFIVVLLVLFKLSGLGSKVETLTRALPELKTRIDTMAAPADTLTKVTTALQNQVGGLHQSMTLLGQSITSISTQAQKIEEIGKKYEETEELTRRIHNIMIGSYEKGRTGENYLRNMMAELMKMGLVRQNVALGGKFVEYCVVFRDGKMLPIDSKVVATKDLESLFDESLSEEERARVKSKVASGLRQRIEEVCKYIDPQTTLPCAVMAVPDSLIGISSEVVPDAVQKNVMIVGYSAVPQLIVYFVRIHSFYSIQEDVAQLKDRLAAIQHKLSTLDEDFFSNRFDRPMTTLSNAVSHVRSVVACLNTIFSLEYKETKQLHGESKE
ncbi:MAG: DNA recombination protein RmuC [Candidatus Bathyarchaeia archaeon]